MVDQKGNWCALTGRSMDGSWTRSDPKRSRPFVIADAVLRYQMTLPEGQDLLDLGRGEEAVLVQQVQGLSR